jgi:hypothetical protein
MTWSCLLVFLLRLGLACLYFTSQNMSIKLILTLECSIKELSRWKSENMSLLKC